MSRIVSPTQFNWTGTRANEVFYKLFGRSFVRSRPGSYRDKNSTAQQLQRSRFKSGNELASKVRGIATLIRENPPTHKSYFSAMCSQFIAAFVNSGSAIVFTPKSAIIGSGSIPRRQCLTLAKATTSSISVTWDTATTSQFEAQTDKVYFLIIDPLLEFPILYDSTNSRNDGATTINVPAAWTGLEIYVSEPFFKSIETPGAKIYTSPFAMCDPLGPVDLQ